MPTGVAAPKAHRPPARTDRGAADAARTGYHHPGKESRPRRPRDAEGTGSLLDEDEGFSGSELRAPEEGGHARGRHPGEGEAGRSPATGGLDGGAEVEARLRHPEEDRAALLGARLEERARGRAEE